MMKRLLLSLLLLCPAALTAFSSPTAFRHVAVYIRMEGLRPLQPLAMEGVARAAYDEKAPANAFDFQTYVLKDTAGYRRHFPAQSYRGWVELYDLVAAWDADSLARIYEARGGTWEEARIPEVMARVLGTDFRVPARDGSGRLRAAATNFIPLRYRGRNCQLLWDDLARLDAYVGGPRLENFSMPSMEHTVDYSLRGVRHVVLGRTRRGNYVLLMVTREVTALPSGLPVSLGAVQPAPAAAEASNRPVLPPLRFDTLASVTGGSGFRYAAVHIRYEADRPARPIPGTGLLRSAYNEEDLVNAFPFRVCLLQDTAGYRARVGAGEEADTLQVFEIVQAWDRDSLERLYAGRGKKWRRQKLRQAMSKLLEPDFRVGRVPWYSFLYQVQYHNVNSLSYKGKNCQAIWDETGRISESVQEITYDDGHTGLVYYYYFDYFLRDARHIILGRTAQGNYVLLLLTRAPLKPEAT